MSASSDWAVEAHGLVKTFDSNRAVDGVGLKVRTGSIYGVPEPNGAGKATAINMHATLLCPEAGTATTFGHDVRKEARIVRKLIGAMAQLRPSTDDSAHPRISWSLGDYWAPADLPGRAHHGSRPERTRRHYGGGISNGELVGAREALDL